MSQCRSSSQDEIPIVGEMTISPIVGDDLAGEESEADDDEQERIETRASDEQTLPEKND